MRYRAPQTTDSPHADAGRLALRILAAALLGVSIAFAAGAEPQPPATSGSPPPASPDPGGSLAAADAAGWIVYPDRRPGPARDYAPSAISLKRVLEPQNPDTPALDWLDLWGPVQSNLAR